MAAPPRQQVGPGPRAHSPAWGPGDKLGRGGAGHPEVLPGAGPPHWFSPGHRPCGSASPHPDPLTPQMAWDPEQASREECPVAEVQVLGET